MTAGKTPVRMTREERRESSRRSLARSMADHDVTQTEAIESTGIAKSVFQRICDRDHREALHLPDAPALPAPVALDQLRWAVGLVGGEKRYAITELPDAAALEGDYGHLAAAIKETGEACAALAETLARGGWTPSQAALVEKETDEGIAALLAVRELARGRLR